LANNHPNVQQQLESMPHRPSIQTDGPCLLLQCCKFSLTI
jgi:hypothetical protein